MSTRVEELVPNPGTETRSLLHAASFVVLEGAGPGLEFKLSPELPWLPLEDGANYQLPTNGITVRWPTSGNPDVLKLLCFDNQSELDFRPRAGSRWNAWPLLSEADTGSKTAGAWALVATLPAATNVAELGAPGQVRYASLGGYIKRLSGSAGFNVAVRAFREAGTTNSVPSWRGAAIQEQDWGLSIDGVPYPTWGGYLRVQPLTTNAAFSYTVHATDRPPFRT